MNALKTVLLIVVALAIFGCAGVERKPVPLDECVTGALEADEKLRGYTSSLDGIAEKLSNFLESEGDTLSDEAFAGLDGCVQKLSVQASIYQAEAMRLTLEAMEDDARYLNGIYDSFLNRRIRNCLR